MKKKQIVCAAVILRNGVVFGALRHSQARANVREMMLHHGECIHDIYWALKDAKNGFIATDGKFYTPAQAYKIALEAGQIQEKETGKLSSKDLY